MSRIERALARRDLKDALAQAERALAQRIEHPLALRVVAEARMEAGRFAEAGDLLNRALGVERTDADTLSAIGVLLVKEGRPEEAVPLFRQTLRSAPEHFPSWLGLAQALEALEQDEPALKAYTRAAELKPEAPAPRAGLAELNLRGGRLDDAEAAARAVLALEPAHPSANLVCARVALARRDAEEARRRAEAVIVRGKLPPFEQLTAFKALGDALDQLDRIPEAVAAYERMNKATVDLYRPRFGPGGAVENHFDLMARLGRGYAGAGALWKTSPPEQAAAPAAAGHVFVLGYPRSGNTLAGAVLAALPDARILEERPTLFDADLAFLRDEAGLARLAELDVEEAERLRALYWRRVRSEIPDLDGARFIDMSPLNSLKLPIIRTLFPSAAIVLCRRDPRDVVLSCWRQSFKINAATYQMTDLGGTARHFDAAMRLVDQSLTLIGGEIHVLRYEAFMADFEGGARALLRAAGAEWSDAVLDFANAARGRQLRTSSAPQIRRGLFDGRRQWARYEACLRPIMPILEPWLAGPNDSATATGA